MSSVTDFVRSSGSQSHLCICNTDLFHKTVVNGVYGFPHAGLSRLKSFWRAVASMYNIGPKDLIFLYRTNGDQPGCQEIHGPFLIYAEKAQPVIYYDLDSPDFPIKIDGNADCKVRFLFGKTTPDVFSIADKYELIKKYETKEIWGYRHPAVMNIGAARKKSVTSFTNKQTLLILSLIREFGKPRLNLDGKVPSADRIKYYNALPNDETHFPLDDDFLLKATTDDEAFLYAYIMRGLRTPASKLNAELVRDFSLINDEMLTSSCGKNFRDLAANVMMETIISPHLQEEMDIVLTDKDDSGILFFEVKTGSIIQDDVEQAQKYLDLLRTIFPHRFVFANIIGRGKSAGVKIEKKFDSFMRLVYYKRMASGEIKFGPA